MQNKKDILLLYSTGAIGRYEAMQRLGYDDFSFLEAAMEEEGLAFFEPSPEDTSRSLSRLAERLHKKAGA